MEAFRTHTFVGPHEREPHKLARYRKFAATSHLRFALEDSDELFKAQADN